MNGVSADSAQLEIVLLRFAATDSEAGRDIGRLDIEKDRIE